LKTARLDQSKRSSTKPSTSLRSKLKEKSEDEDLLITEESELEQESEKKMSKIDKETVAKEMKEKYIPFMNELPDNVTLDEAADEVYAMTRMLFGDITKGSAAKQVAVGGATGWVSGYMINKAGKVAIVTLGASALLVTYASKKGYIKVDWLKVQHAMTEAAARAEKKARENQATAFEKAKTFYREHWFLATGFTGGLVAGLFL